MTIVLSPLSITLPLMTGLACEKASPQFINTRNVIAIILILFISYKQLWFVGQISS
jgi:hypothetical protein